jgi:metallo-beta-lactamase family protein
MSTFTVTFAGGAQTPTGSNFILDVGGKRILIDCGLYQGEKVSLDNNMAAFTYDVKSIDALFVTHAHLDHVGRIPKLVRDGYTNPIYSTQATREIAELVLLDSMGVLGKEAARENKPVLYQEKDVFDAMRLWKDLTYHQKFEIAGSDGPIIAEYYDSGHILGSGIITFTYQGKKIAFTGDLGNTPSPLMRDTELIDDLDYLAIESVYGDRNHEDYETRVSLLKDAITSTIKAGGTLMIPAFSVERTQELLYYFNQLVEKGDIPLVPVYLDSPLAINVTAVYKKYEALFNVTANSIIKSGDDIFNFKGLVMTKTPEESKSINNVVGPKVIMAGSGMSNGGRILHHEARYLSDSKSTLLVVGYQATGTLGRKLVDGAKEVIIHGVPVPVRARIVNIHGFSAHKDSDHLVEFAGASQGKIKKAFVILGEPKSAYFLAQRLHEEYGYDVTVPELDQKVELE